MQEACPEVVLSSEPPIELRLLPTNLLMPASEIDGVIWT
jgi:hypothetical protein